MGVRGELPELSGCALTSIDRTSIDRTSADGPLPEARDIFGDGFFADPHGVYAGLREQGPVHRVVTPNRQHIWLVIGYEEARSALADPRLSKDTKTAWRVYEKHTDPGMRERDFAPSMAAHMLNTDPPEHTRLRGLVGREFTPRTVEALRPRIRELAEPLLNTFAERLAAGETVDLLDDFALPLPLAIICELLGIPEPARPVLRDIVGGLLSTGNPAVIDRASHEAVALVAGVLQAKRADPGDDLLTALLAAHDDGDRLSDPELVSMAILLLVAGHETTVNLLATGSLNLLRDPERLHQLRDTPELLESAVEELLRFDGPVNTSTLRFTRAPVELGGTVIPAEHPIAISPLAANRDPARYPDPHRLDFTRDASGHLAFGHGIHFCVGAALARVEAYEVLPLLLELLPTLEIAVPAEELPWRRSILVHGLRALPVRSAR